MVGHNKRVLEVGCAIGYFTQAMVERGCKVVGIELNPDAAALAEEWAERVVVGDIDRGELWNEVDDESFDVVLCGDVLEHLRDPLGALRAAVRKLHSYTTPAILVMPVESVDPDYHAWIVAARSSTLPFCQKLSSRAPVCGCMRGV